MKKDYFLNIFIFIVIGISVLLTIVSIKNKLVSHPLTISAIEEYAEEYDYYYPYEYVSETEYWDADEDIQNAITKAYTDGFEKGAKNAIDYFNSED